MNAVLINGVDSGITIGILRRGLGRIVNGQPGEGRNDVSRHIGGLRQAAIAMTLMIIGSRSDGI